MVRQVTKSELKAAISDSKKDMAILEGKLSMEIEVMKHDIKEIKSEVCSVKAGMTSIENKLDAALEKKADQSEVDEIKRGLFWAVTAAIGLLLTIIGYLITSHIGG